MIDSHCHLADEQFSNDLDDVIDRARKAHVSPMVTIADSLPEAKRCIEIAEAYDDVFCTVGVHPHEAKNWKSGDGEKIKEMVAASKKVKAVGEIGLDYHYDHSPRGKQRGVFLEQLTLSRELGLPAVVHCREAIEDVKTMVLEVEPLQMVLHCCTEKWGDVEWLVELGHMVSFTGMVTYPKPAHILEVIKNTPINQIMIETDSPYLAPVPYRGKRNEPAYVTEVLACVAKTKGMTMKEVDEHTTKNAIDFFNLK